MASKRSRPPTEEELKAKALSRWEGEGGAPAGRRTVRPPAPRAGPAEGNDRQAPQPGGGRGGKTKPPRSIIHR